ncbi:MAG: beta galactosidase jelly roll domain-containing protein [Melioribacteraceae bacterium]|nr:beta galactosidase jelly roll domain-containing protein [Melioribacteraceae bacterium]
MRLRYILLQFLFLGLVNSSYSQSISYLNNPSSEQSLFLRSKKNYNGNSEWTIKKFSDTKEDGSIISRPGYKSDSWLPAIIPGTVLNSLVANKIYPEPYYSDNNRKSKKLIPDISDVGREFYHYWFRTDFRIPQSFKGKRVWLKFHGINYRCEIWVNGKFLGKMEGMFNSQSFDITSIADLNNENAIAVNMQPVDNPGTTMLKDKRPGAVGENHNGGDGMIGKDVTMLMSVGWDFTATDGIRDRNTGIWRDVELYATGDVVMENLFVQTKLPLPDTTSSLQTVSVEVVNCTDKEQSGILKGIIEENKITFEKKITLSPNERKEIIFSPAEYKQLLFKNPKLWWPKNKGEQNLYTLNMEFIPSAGKTSHRVSTRFGIREISSDQNTPDQSRRFIVNGHPVFIRGTNWIPEAMLRNSEERTLSELRYTNQSGLNLIRLWGGGIAESDYFYELCDQYGILVWAEFWMTGDTKYPVDTLLYFKNVENTVKRIRNHPSLAYYVSSNESTEMPGAPEVFRQLDSTRGYQMQSECCGVHDGSPYKYENPMQYFENTASRRGSRVDGFNPEYGTPILPVYESLKEMMDEKDLWPINDSLWNYLDGGGFHQVTTKYKDAVNQFGESSSIEEFAVKAQFVGAMNYRVIWEVWNYNKFNYGDRFASGFLFWYHNSPLPQVASRMYDHSLEPTAALYYSQNGLAPLHPQFDYLKNTVSVYNDYRVSFKNYSVSAMVYDLNSKLVSSIDSMVDIPADGVANDALKIEFPSDITQVHFIKLYLKDPKGKIVSDAFYWRSKDIYEGAWTMTGPAVSGFQDINKLPEAKLDLIFSIRREADKIFIDSEVVNNSSSLVFFTRLHIVNSTGESIKPVYYSDNFFSLLPNEKKQVVIEVSKDYLNGDEILLSLSGWNVSKIQKNIFIHK